MAGLFFWRRRPAGAADAELDALCSDLRNQLGPFGYQWLCACAVYPVLRFTLSVSLGQALATALGRTAPVDEDDHAALFRLPWFRTGEMPEALRRRLIRDLVPAAADATRSAIERLLLAALDPPAPANPGQPLPLPPPPRGWSARVRAFVASAPADALEADPLLARFLARRPIDDARIAGDRRRRRRADRWCGPRLATWLDRRTVLGAAVALGWAGLALVFGDSWLGPWPEARIAETRRIETFQECPDCPEMAVIPAGEFLMGSPESEAGRYIDEGPQHPVRVNRFAIGRTEVTFDQWDACVAAGGCNRYRPGDQGWGRGRRPVIKVSWDDAQTYVRWLSARTGQPYRLPSEAEWEYAARAGTTTPYWWGEYASPQAAHYNVFTGTREVTAYPPNPWGLWDTAGNVWEWVEDRLHNSYAGAPAEGSAWVSGDNSARVLRGGSWVGTPGRVRAALRSRDAPGYRSDVSGLRVARTLNP